MSVSVTMLRLGESVSEGTVTRWLKQEGDKVEADEPLLEVSTDKVDTEIPSPAAGVLSSIKVGEDETVEVGSELAVIDEGGGGGGGADAKADEQESEPEAAAEPAEQDDDAEPAKDEQQREPEQDGEDEGESAASAEQREEVADDAAGDQSDDDGAADEKPARDARAGDGDDE